MRLNLANIARLLLLTLGLLLWLSFVTPMQHMDGQATTDCSSHCVTSQLPIDWPATLVQPFQLLVLGLVATGVTWLLFFEVARTVGYAARPRAAPDLNLLYARFLF